MPDHGPSTATITRLLSLGLRWGAIMLARQAPSLHRTIRLRRSTIQAVLALAVVLVAVIRGAVLIEPGGDDLLCRLAPDDVV
jgi:hypothetical protein